MKRRQASCLAAPALLLGVAMTAEAAPATGAVRAEALSDTLSLLVEARINGKPVEGLIGLDILADGCARIETAALRMAGLYAGNADAACLQSVDGIDYTLDRHAARLDIFFAEAPERRRTFFPKQTYAPPVSGIMGGYSLSGQRIDDGRREMVNAFGDLSTTLHTPLGRVQNDMIASYGDDAFRVRRLVTVFERDFPGSMTRLSLGDSFTRAPRWGRNAAFAGVQYGTDFSMDPSDGWRPYRTFQALLREQSQVDVRVNGAVRRRQSVEPGYSNFDIVPESGLNEVEIIIHEANGLSRIEDFSFFASSEALGEGITDYSVAVGVPRSFRGMASEYDDSLLASGMVRHGLSDRLTAEAYGELAQEAGLLGGGGQISAGRIGLLSLSVGISRTDDGETGRILSAGFERNTRRASVQLQARLADPDYTDSVSTLGAPFPDRSIRASGGIYTDAGSFRASYTEEQDKVLRDRRFLSFGWEKPFRKDRVSLALSAYQDFERDETGFAINLRASFGAFHGGGGYQSADGRKVSTVQLSRLRQPGETVQWAVRAADGDGGGVYQGDVAADLGMADLIVSAGKFGAASQVMTNLRGGFAAMPGRMALQKQTTGAAAVVRMPQLKGVAIYKDNRVIAVTGEDGVALIPEVRPYQVNTLSLRPEDIPLEYDLRDFSVRFLPGRGLSQIHFDVSRDTSLAFNVRLADGAVLPPGTRVELVGSGVVCPVGFQGRVYCPVVEEEDAIAITLPAGRYVQTVEEVRARGELQMRPGTGLKLAGVD